MPAGRPRAPTCAKGCSRWRDCSPCDPSDPADARLQELLRRPLPDDAEHAEALRLLRAHPAVDMARAEARRWADDARDVLVPLPATASSEALLRLCDYVVGRTA